MSEATELSEVLEPTGAARADSFLRCGDGVDALDDPTPFGHENALQKLGRPPFEKSVRSKFRLLGFLATVYEHVSADVRGDSQPAGDGDGDGEETGSIGASA